MTELERAYRDGQIDAKIADHDAHFKVLNGSLERSAGSLARLERAVEKQGDQLVGLLVVMPKLQVAVDDVDASRSVAARYRTVIAWALGSATGAIVLADQLGRII